MLARIIKIEDLGKHYLGKRKSVLFWDMLNSACNNNIEGAIENKELQHRRGAELRM